MGHEPTLVDGFGSFQTNFEFTVFRGCCGRRTRQPDGNPVAQSWRSAETADELSSLSGKCPMNLARVPEALW